MSANAKMMKPTHRSQPKIALPKITKSLTLIAVSKSEMEILVVLEWIFKSGWRDLCKCESENYTRNFKHAAKSSERQGLKSHGFPMPSKFRLQEAKIWCWNLRLVCNDVYPQPRRPTSSFRRYTDRRKRSAWKRCEVEHGGRVVRLKDGS